MTVGAKAAEVGVSFGLVGLAYCWYMGKCGGSRIFGRKKEKNLKDVDDLDSIKSPLLDNTKMDEMINKIDDLKTTNADSGVKQAVKVFTRRSSSVDIDGLLDSRDASTRTAEHAMERRQIVYVKVPESTASSSRSLKAREA